VSSTLTSEELAAAVAALDADGYAVVPGVLDGDEVADAVERLWRASEETRRRGGRTHIAHLDPNDRNVRVNNLVDLDPLFARLLGHPAAEAVAAALLGDDFVVSNFSANIALPGSGSMFVHSDQPLVAPEPWLEPWSMNVIWCLSDVRFDNGGTLYMPGSHRFPTRADVPDDVVSKMVAFEAPAGSIVAMEGRVWHTSGANVTADEERPLLFAYYTRSFLRPQWNFAVALRPEVQESLDRTMRYRLGLDVALNVGFAPRLGTATTAGAT
jgi:ectoine hydroxylase-related dioxygenase (phytanoyl-CoA dioxygenase family)